MKGLAVNLTAYGKPAPPPSHSPWKTLRVSHSLTASTTNISDLTLYRGTPNRDLLSKSIGRARRSHLPNPGLKPPWPAAS